MHAPSALLSNHHRELQVACGELRDAICGADRIELMGVYRRFEESVLAHFATEEELLLPAYAEHFPATARQLLEEHAALRRLLMHVAIDVELHVVRVEQLDRLLDRLRKHAACEEVTLYGWIDQRLDARATSGLAERLTRSGPSVERAWPVSRPEHTGFSR